MEENKTTVTTREPQTADCVTQIRMGNTVLVVNGFFKQNATETAADKMAKVLAAEGEMIRRNGREKAVMPDNRRDR